MMGIARVSALALSRRASVRPFMPGSRRSSRTTSGFSAAIASTASSAEVVPRTMCPFMLSTAPISFRSVGWSSTTRTFMSVLLLLAFAFAFAQQLRHQLRQFSRIDRLGDVAVTARLGGFLFVPLHGEGRQGDHRDVLQPFVVLQFACKREAVHSRQGDVHENQVWLGVLENFLRQFGIGRSYDGVALGPEDVGGEFQIDRIVVDDKDAGAHASLNGLKFRGLFRRREAES